MALCVQLAERGGLLVLVGLAQGDDVVLRDLQAAATRALALLSTSDALKPRLAQVGVLPLLCSAGGDSSQCLPLSQCLTMLRGAIAYIASLLTVCGDMHPARAHLT